MTNEQLAEFIQEGEADDLKPVLWERVKHLCFKICGNYFARYEKRFNACGVELSDVRQECYPAFVKALESFKPAKELQFTSYLNYHVINACRRLLGIANGQNNKPLDNCTSLDIPLNAEGEKEITLQDTVCDESAFECYEKALQAIDDRQTREVLTRALKRLDKPLRDVIVQYYFIGISTQAIAHREGVSRERIHQRRNMALRKLRSMPDVCMLREGQRIEQGLHFTSLYYGQAYYIAQQRIREILRRGSYLSYGQQQAILYDCAMREAVEKLPEKQAL